MKYLIKKPNGFLCYIVSMRDKIFHWENDLDRAMLFSQKEVRKMYYIINECTIINEKGVEMTYWMKQVQNKKINDIMKKTKKK